MSGKDDSLIRTIVCAILLAKENLIRPYHKYYVIYKCE